MAASAIGHLIAQSLAQTSNAFEEQSDDPSSVVGQSADVSEDGLAPDVSHAGVQSVNATSAGGGSAEILAGGQSSANPSVGQGVGGDATEEKSVGTDQATARRQGAKRAAELINVAHKLGDAIANTLIEGEQTTVLSAALNLAIGKFADPCDERSRRSATRLEGSNSAGSLSAPAFSSGGNISFVLPVAALSCTQPIASARKRRLHLRRMQMTSASSCAATGDGEADSGLHLVLAVFRLNPLSKPENGSLSTPLTDIRLSQCGQEKVIIDAPEPMRLGLEIDPFALPTEKAALVRTWMCDPPSPHSPPATPPPGLPPWPRRRPRTPERPSSLTAWPAASWESWARRG